MMICSLGLNGLIDQDRIERDGSHIRRV